MREFLEFIAKHLVDKPGKVIGRKGRTANAMRVLLSAVAAKEGKRAVLEILQ